MNAPTEHETELAALRRDYPDWTIRTERIAGGLLCVAQRRTPLDAPWYETPGLYDQVRAVGLGALRVALEGQNRRAASLRAEHRSRTAGDTETGGGAAPAALVAAGKGHR
ncbi:hypothetical protein HNR23_002276 [Nocardiopsis mwathae]|uniref:Uncharacterized protein n=1 Tax=Nocardiopsis mwathae TaxID=1472723 RepID=A0A7W9YIN5_9ACTN|nr:hypothetical protein [Nocardiopsis mwathae]MBB6172216.1 hypothetical protein [Nocardiopsis mwathae]